MEQLFTRLEERHLPAAEPHGDENLVASGEEFPRVLEPVVDVVLSGFRMQADLLDVGDVRLGLGLVTAALLFVLVLAVVHQLADRRVGVGADLDEIGRGLRRRFARLVNRDDAGLLAVGADEPDPARADLFIDQ